MRGLPLLLAVAALLPRAADARPTADVVVVWAPGTRIAPVEQVARQAGAAVIDRSPAAQQTADTAGMLKRGITAYDALRFPDALAALDEAKAAVDRTGAAGVTQTELSDLFLYRGLVKIQQGDPTSAWDELITSVTVNPARVLDPARFPPRVAQEIERARTSLVDRQRATLAVAAPDGCSVTIDGAPVGAAPSAAALPGAGVPRIIGPHWTNVTCVDRGPWGTRLELTGDTTITPRNAPLTPPTTDEVLIQARTAGAQAFVYVEVQGVVGTARLIGIEGRERDRRSVTLTGDIAPLAAAVRDLLRPSAPTKWYQSRWAWAGGAAILAAAILVPITAVIARDNSPSTATLNGALPWPKP